MKNIFKICKNNSILKSALSYVITNNTGSVNPYHSCEHIFNVFLYAKEGAEYHSLPEKETLNLLLAALFHDFNHSGGEAKDSVNIQHAKSGVTDWNKNEDSVLINEDLIHDMIDITEFPYILKSESLNLPQRILRDADMGSIFTDNWFQTIMLGLSNEANTTLKDFIEQQRSFITNLKGNTEWFNETKIPLIEEKLKELDLYSEYV